ncbi:MAG: hypothetical protein ACPGSG_02175 [Prolixibacteraceae bacterium]|jgi:hypothetical protein|nr:hypothetical protein [Prolixibacteraceae bacterium]
MKETKKLAIAFILGLCTMYAFDYIFHFNNPKSKVEIQVDKASKGIKSLFK